MRSLHLILFALVLFTGCARRETVVEAARRTQTLHVNNLAEPRDFDPHTTTLPADMTIIRAITEGLTEVDPVDCHAIPGVAERWTMSEDGRTWTFHLRGDARWSNGDAVTAHDFVYAFRRALSPALGAEYREQFFILQGAADFAAGKLTDFAQVGARATDDRTLVLRLVQPVPYLAGMVAQVWWFPVHRATIEKFGKMDERATAWTRAGNHVGNGAFVLKTWVAGQPVRIEKSATYWDRAKVRLNEVFMHPIEQPGVGEAAFRAGQLHLAIASIDKAAAYKADPRTAPLLEESALLQTAFYRLNLERPPLGDVRVRRALSLALDREQLARRVIKSDQPAFALTPPNCAGYTADRSCPTDVDEAKRLLAAAGFPEGKGFPRLELLLYQHTGMELPVAEAIQQMWRQRLGIEIALVQQEMKTAIAARRTRSYDILGSNWLGDYLDPTTFLDLLQSTNGNNQTGWASAEYDRLLAQASTTLEQTKRYDLLRRAEALMLAEAPIVPLYYVPKRQLRHPAVRGWHGNLLDLHPLKFVYLEN
ncbi:MAG TPA: peptide ABC transporter substrate-binding protein [Opitutaceae bacterium]|nr:peptide ABC transporter substrate-binding protein [Opitutaceae bacterium]